MYEGCFLLFVHFQQCHVSIQQDRAYAEVFCIRGRGIFQIVAISIILPSFLVSQSKKNGCFCESTRSLSRWPSETERKRVKNWKDLKEIMGKDLFYLLATLSFSMMIMSPMMSLRSVLMVNILFLLRSIFLSTPAFDSTTTIFRKLLGTLIEYTGVLRLKLLFTTQLLCCKKESFVLLFEIEHV